MGLFKLKNTDKSRREFSAEGGSVAVEVNEGSIEIFNGLDIDGVNKILNSHLREILSHVDIKSDDMKVKIAEIVKNSIEAQLSDINFAVSNSTESIVDAMNQCIDDMRNVGSEQMCRLNERLDEIKNDIQKRQYDLRELSTYLDSQCNMLARKVDDNTNRIIETIRSVVREDGDKTRKAIEKLSEQMSQLMQIVLTLNCNTHSSNDDREKVLELSKQVSNLSLQMSSIQSGFCDNAVIEQFSIKINNLFQQVNELTNKANDNDLREKRDREYLCGIKNYRLEKYREAVEHLRVAAELDDSWAQFYLGLCYLNGTGIEQSTEQAIKLFQSAAIGQIDSAMYHLGNCYFNGIGVEQNYQIAHEWYKKASELGYPSACYMIGLFYEKGYYVQKNEYKAVEFYKKANELNAEQLHVIDAYSDIKLSTYQVEKPLQMILNGQPEAQYALGWCYCNGIGVEKNPQKAVEWFYKAADNGHVWAQYTFAECMEKGFGINKNLLDAKKWYLRSALQGCEQADDACYRFAHIKADDADSEQNIGDMLTRLQYYDSGEDKLKQNPPDWNGAVRDFIISANAGNEDAENQLGLICTLREAQNLNDDTTEIKLNNEVGVALYKRMVKKGNPFAMSGLAYYYESGAVVGKGKQDAIELLTLASEAGNPIAQFRLGLIYEQGLFIKRDVGKAIELFEKAARKLPYVENYLNSLLGNDN